MSDSNRVQLSYIEETGSYGVTPAGNLKIMRFTNEGLAQITAQQDSAEIQVGRNVNDIIRTSINAEGPIGFEFSAGTHDDFLSAAIGSAGFSAAVVVHAGSVLISATSGTNTLAISAGSWTNTPTVNSWIKITGFANAANNGLFKVTSATTNTIVVSPTGLLITEAAGPNITITQGGQAVNGVAIRSFSIEKKYADLTNIFTAYVGSLINTMSLSISEGNKITGDFGLLGKSEQDKVATIGTGYTQPNTNVILSGVDDAKYLTMGSLVYPSVTLTMQLTNNARMRKQIGTLGPVSMGTGTLGISGTLNAYFATTAAMQSYLNDVSTPISVIIQDANTPANAYVFEWPRVVFTTGKRVAGGQNTDIIAELGWRAKRDPTEDMMMKIVRWP